MIRMKLALDLVYEINSPSADFLFNIHCANTPSQFVLTEQLEINQALPAQVWTEANTHNRYLRLHADPGELRISYEATLEILHHFENPQSIQEVPVCSLPTDVIEYLYPSRYCQSDRLLRLAASEFGGMTMGYGRVQAICNWVNRYLAFTPNTTNSMTSAADTVIQRVGICRDYAHLMITLCRAINIPARFVTGTDYGCPAGYGPPDFHAYVEVYLADRWYIFDPTGLTIPMGLVRIGTGRDAADVSFATIFGSVSSLAPRIEAVALTSGGRDTVMPYFPHSAISTMAA
jgi:transglutaminase-like putative cysteine protease